MRVLPPLIALAAAVALATIGIARGTYAAGGSDSSCYALMAEAFASGRLQPSSDLVSQVPWPEAAKTFTPGGFVPFQTNATKSSPICAPGFSLLLAPFAAVGGQSGMFYATPLAGALLVWLAFLAGKALHGSIAGAMSAVLVAASPAVLYQVVQPMNDIATAALWMAVYVALIGRRWTLAGVCCGLALLVRPNLLPLACLAALTIGIRSLTLGIGDWRLGIGSVPRFSVGTLPFVVLVLLLNDRLYGSPFRTGYGQLENLFSLSVFPTNASRYLGWLIETHSVFPLLAFAAPFLVAKERRADAALAIGLTLTTCGIYVFYTPFDDWSYLRFLLPAIVLMIVLASAVVVRSVEGLLRYGPAKAGHYGQKAAPPNVVSGFSRTVIPAVITITVAVFFVRTARDRHAFNLQFLEQRYRSAGRVVRDRLPANAVVLSVWDSGAVRFHGRKEALAWESLDPAWLDRSLQWLAQHEHPPYILVESWEEPGFRSRFAGHSDIGKLDWPPKYEIDRVVRIYDPSDRQRFDRGEAVNTEYLWPLR